MEVFHTSPEASSFVTIAEHQSRTPSSFHAGPPVLHYHSQRCKVVILERDLLATPALNALRGERASANGTSVDAAQEAQDDEGHEIAIEDVDTWVTSEKFVLYSPSASTGISIPYPSISLHAIQRLRVPGAADEVQGLYMQIAVPTAPSSEDDEEQCITMTVVPPGESGAAEITAEARAAQDLSDEPAETPTQMLYNAVSACSNLHPDPVEPGDEDDDEEGMKFMSAADHGYALFQLGQEAMGSSNGEGDLPPPVEGSSGWITADNMHEYFDEEGNWIAEGEPPSFPGLGPGAGTIRAREDENGTGGQEGTGTGTEGESEETKWRRTD